MTQNNRENNQNDLIGYSSAECQPALFRRRSPRDPLLNSPARESVSQWSNSGQEEPLFSTTKTKSRSGKSPSRPAPTSPRPSVRRVPGVSALHLQNSDSLASSSLEPSILRSDVPDLYENDTGSPVDSRFGPARWNPQSRVLLTQTTRSSGTRTQQREFSAIPLFLMIGVGWSQSQDTVLLFIHLETCQKWTPYVRHHHIQFDDPQLFGGTIEVKHPAQKCKLRQKPCNFAQNG